MEKSIWASRRTERLDPSKNLKTFTVFNDLIPELRVKIWSHCLVPPGRTVFENYSTSASPSFGPDEAVVATSDNFFWKGTPVIFQICRESRYEGKRLINPVTKLEFFHGQERFHPSFEVRTFTHPPAFKLTKLWFSVKDTIEIPIRSYIELRHVEAAAGQIAQAWVQGTNPLKVRKIQFSFFVDEYNKMSADVVDYLSTISSVVSELGSSVTIFIGMGAGYAHKKGRFYLNDAQGSWTYNEDGTLCDEKLQAKLTKRRKRLIPKDEQCAVNSAKEAYMQCLNSEIIEEHLATINARIHYVDQIRGGLVRDASTGGWERGEAYRLGLSFEKSRLCTMVNRAVV